MKHVNVWKQIALFTATGRPSATQSSKSNILISSTLAKHSSQDCMFELIAKIAYRTKKLFSCLKPLSYINFRHTLITTECRNKCKLRDKALGICGRMTTLTIAGCCFSLNKKENDVSLPYENRTPLIQKNPSDTGSEELPEIPVKYEEQPCAENPPCKIEKQILNHSIISLECESGNGTSVNTDLNNHKQMLILSVRSDPTNNLTVDKETMAKETLINIEAKNTSSIRLQCEDDKELDVTNVNDIDSKVKFPSKGNTKKRKRKCTSLDEEGGDKKMIRPNYFAAIQIADPMIHANLKNVQDHIVEGENRLKAALVSIATLHLTLLVFRINSEEDLEKAREAMEKCYNQVKNDFTENPVHLHFQGLSEFRKQVLFAKARSDESLQRIIHVAKLLQACFEETGLSLPGNWEEFKPHLTILKLSKAPKLRKMGIRTVRKGLYEEYTEKYFGSQIVTSLQLLSMEKRRTEDGYYHCDGEYRFDVCDNSVDSLLKACIALQQKKVMTKEEVRCKISTITQEQLEAMAKEKE